MHLNHPIYKACIFYQHLPTLHLFIWVLDHFVAFVKFSVKKKYPNKSNFKRHFNQLTFEKDFIFYINL